MSEEKKGSEPQVVIIKAEMPEVMSSALELEDEYSGMYYNASTGEGRILVPPYVPAMLKRQVAENNALGQCIAAMEVNIDGTGYDIGLKDEEDPTPEQEAEIKRIKAFFDEPYPGKSMISIRRALRVDMESTGMGYLEVLRNAAGALMFVRHLDCSPIRLLKLDEPVSVRKVLYRDGAKFEITVSERERAFVQKIGNRKVYFKEYGASRDINKDTGAWGKQGERLPAAERGTELIPFGISADYASPYYVPRWINQTPSVVGSREAEEMNIRYFQTGGVPPVIVFLTNGVMGEEGKKALRNVSMGKAKDKLQMAIVETMASGGSIDSAGTTGVIVERFAQEQHKDSMFEGYDDKCERRVRSSFRLAPLFVGKAEDYSYATAFASYSVGEAQVFKPERDEFDEVMNVTIMRELAPPEYEYRSNPLSVHDAVVKLKAIDLAKDNVEPENLVETLNKVANTHMVYQEAKTPPNDDNGEDGVVDDPTSQGPTQPSESTAVPVNVSKADPFELMTLATEAAKILGLDKGVLSSTEEDVRTRISNLSLHDRDLFDVLFAARTLESVEYDTQRMTELSRVSADMLGADYG